MTVHKSKKFLSTYKARLITVTVLILLIPLVAMQFTNEVDWNLADFVVIGGLIMGTGLIYEFASSKVRSSEHRAVIAAVLLIAFFLTWAELAVGVFGTPFAGS